MKKTEARNILKGLLIVLKIILAIPSAAVFILMRGIQYFLKMCGTIVSYVCILASVMASLAAAAELVLQVKGDGPGLLVIILTVVLAAALASTPILGVAMVMVILESVCTWIWKFYMGDSKNWKNLYKRPDYQWSAFADGYKGKETDDSEFELHYFKGIKSREELTKRYHGLLRIYRPEDVFGEDEITRSIMEEYDYLKNKFPEEESM